MPKQEILSSPLIPSFMNTKIYAWNEGQTLPGYIRVSDIVNQLFLSNSCPAYIEWSGDGIYPLTLTHERFLQPLTRGAIIYRITDQFIFHIVPMLDGLGMSAFWSDLAGATKVAVGAIRADTMNDGSVIITNTQTPAPELNAPGYDFRMVLF